MNSKSHYNKSLKQFSRKLRNESTLGEVILWRDILSKRQMLGFQFLRQYSLENFIVDFICRKLRLIIEIDGYSHEEKYEKDLMRDKILNEMGYVVIRFKEQEVYKELENVKNTIENKIYEKLDQSPQTPFAKGDLSPD